MPGTPTVAKPGTSRHETGRAIDVPEPTRAWLHRTGAEYGWTNPADNIARAEMNAVQFAQALHLAMSRARQ